MAIEKVVVYANCDTATVVWQTDAPIRGCRGFALERKTEGSPQTEFVKTWVGFKGQAHAEGAAEPSTVWPIQRYMWSDYLVRHGTRVSYRVVPMVRENGNLVKVPANEWSAWTDWVEIRTGETKGVHAYFNLGIVPAQWMARQASSPKVLQALLSEDIKKPGSKNRDTLSGELRQAMLSLLKQAKQDKVEIYAALYELNDPELVALLKSIGARCFLILGSGAYKAADKKNGTPAVRDENKQVRQDLKKNSKIQVFDRLVKSPHFAHNKFVVFCDQHGLPEKVWTGSTNWTVTGLCTQTNNGILIESRDIAAGYLERWKKLKEAGSGYPNDLAEEGSKATSGRLGPVHITAWNTPATGYVDLKDAKQRIAGAKQGVLFLMFNPGTGDGKVKEFALIQDILALDPDKLFIHGVLNQDPGGKKDPIITLTHKGTSLPAKSLPAILPKNLVSAGRRWFRSTFMFNMVMIHSKVIVIDPFGKWPVVMTGSHNMGPKASQSNDDNLVIIENAPELAAEYAVNIMGIYGHYKWMFNESLKSKSTANERAASPQYDGNYDDDTWQEWYQSGPNLREIEFWFGE